MKFCVVENHVTSPVFEYNLYTVAIFSDRCCCWSFWYIMLYWCRTKFC